MTDYSELKSAAEASIKAWDQHSRADSHEFYETWCAAEQAFSMAAREEVVLALIAENEALKAQLSECAEFIDNAPGDYAEMEALSKSANRYQHIKSTWSDGGLIDRLAANVLPEDWDAAIDADMGKGG